MKDKLLEALFGVGGLLRVRALIAFILTITTSYMWISGNTVPSELLGLTTGAVAFYFGRRGSE